MRATDPDTTTNITGNGFYADVWPCYEIRANYMVKFQDNQDVEFLEPNLNFDC